MRKRIRLVLIEDDSSDVEGIMADARTHYPDDRYQFGERAVLLLTSDLTTQIVAKLGLDGDDESSGRSGIALTLDYARAGYADDDLWEWLREAEASLRNVTV